MDKEIFPEWLPRQVAEHYGFPLSVTGKGQSIGVISLGGKPDLDKLKQAFATFDCPMPDIQVVDVNPEQISARQNSDPALEAQLDLQVIGMICPDASITLYRAPGDQASGFADAVDKAVQDGNSVISISWSYTEEDGVADSPLEKALEAARVAGVTVCVSASDWGSSNTRGPSMMLPGAAPDGGAHVCYPASSPLVLACGGTELMEMEDGSGVQTERVWNNAVKDGKAAERGGATGGGVSRQFDIPEWQTRAGVRIDCVSTGKTGRVVPDVAGLAAAADWKIYVIGHGVSPDGGTSAVAPLWASLILMANQLRAEAGKGPLGHVNERLYELAAAGGVFRDVTVGDNRSAPAYPCYAAGPGFDACTGWGAPEGEALIKALVALD